LGSKKIQPNEKYQPLILPDINGDPYYRVAPTTTGAEGTLEEGASFLTPKD
jgi:hypothetical protein